MRHRSDRNELASPQQQPEPRAQQEQQHEPPEQLDQQEQQQEHEGRPEEQQQQQHPRSRVPREQQLQRRRRARVARVQQPELDQQEQQQAPHEQHEQPEQQARVARAQKPAGPDAVPPVDTICPLDLQAESRAATDDDLLRPRAAEAVHPFGRTAAEDEGPARDLPHGRRPGPWALGRAGGAAGP